MPYALGFDGVNDVVSIPSGMTGNVGTSTYSFRIKSGPAGITLPASGLAGIIGTTQATTSNGLIINSTGQIRVYSAGTNRYGSTAQLIFSGVEFDYTLTHSSAGGAWDIYNNLTSSPTGESGNFTTSVTWAAGSNSLNQFGRSSSNNTVYLQGDIVSIEVTGLVNAQDWEANLSGGAGTTLPTVSGTNQGTLNNFTAPDCWIFYSTGSSFTGTIGKTSLAATTKQLLLSLGYTASTGKSTLTLNLDQLLVSAGSVLGVGKQALVLNTKSNSTQLGYVNVLSKQGYNLLTKQLSVVVGANLPFTGVLNKTSYPVSSKQLSVNAGLNINVIKNINALSTKQFSNTLGWNSGVSKQTLSVSGKQESANLGLVLLLQKWSVALSSKPLTVQSGASIPFLGVLNKVQLNLTGKPLSVSAGTVIPFLGSMNKTSLMLSGKVLEGVRGQVIECNHTTLNLLTKLLSIGEVLYPVINRRRVNVLTDSPIRLHELNDKPRIYIMRR